MAERLTLLCGPAGSGKSARLLQRVGELVQTQTENILVLLPTGRAKLAWCERFFRQHPQQVGCLVLTFQEFVEQIIQHNDPSARPLSHVQRKLLADQVVKELNRLKKLDRFRSVLETRGFAEGIFALLAEWKKQEVWPEELARVFAERAATGRLQPKHEHCLRIYESYQEWLVNHNLYDLEGRFWYARDLLQRGQWAPFGQVRAVFLDHFVTFTATELQILQTLSQHCEEFWCTLPDEPDDCRAELFAQARSTKQALSSLSLGTEWCTQLEMSSKPAGLKHLEAQLFQPPQRTARSAQSTGLKILSCAGPVGEARMVARSVKSLLLSGVPADDIVLSLRDLAPSADLLREVFREFGIPHDCAETEPILRNSALATLLRAARLADDNWPFAPLLTLLRSGYFRPAWPECAQSPSIAEHAEMLLRLLGEPRGRDAYLQAVEQWADRPPKPPEDDDPGQLAQYQRKHQLALLCRPFLQRFFQAWQGAPTLAPLVEHLGWLKQFALEIGLTGVARETPRDHAACSRLFDELTHWQRLDKEFKHPPLTRVDFHRLLQTIALEAGIRRTPRGPGRVRMLPAELAQDLPTPYLFVLGLSERSFPKLSVPEPFFNESEKQAFQLLGLNLGSTSQLLPAEMLLFYRLVTSARQQLVLSYPGVDEKGQQLLPSSFLSAVLHCFEPGAVPTESRRMLIEGYSTEPPLCPAEQRVQAACALGTEYSVGVPNPLAEHLSRAARLAYHRFDSAQFTPYDGMLQQPVILEELQQLFKPERVLSPTALETYVACPSRFYYQHVLKLEPLEEPSEAIESTERGQVFHRVLSRLHLQLQSEGIAAPTDDLQSRVVAHLETAIREQVQHASPTQRVLWQLEGQRLKKRAERYPQDWQKFLSYWEQAHIAPVPTLFEKSFGLKALPGEVPADPLIIRHNGREARVGGRIDRVDVAQTPEGTYFWIIDYKTGKGSFYTGSSLKKFHRLQLTLYALAVQQVLLPDAGVRPLNLAYWLVTDSGPKLVLPASPHHLTWYREPARWDAIREQLAETVLTLVSKIRAGEFPLQPKDENCTETCPYAAICRINQARAVEKRWTLELPLIP